MAYAFPGSEVGGHGHGHASASHSTPSSRTSRKATEDAFDVLREFKLKIEEDENYIDFFQERIRIEEGYVKQLQKLLDRTVAIDSLQEDHPAHRIRTSARKGWVEVRDYTSREIDSRNALVMALRSAIIPDLAKIKDEQERIRLGLKENVRVSNEMYDDHLKHHVPRLKKAYWQKCQALEDYKRQEAAIVNQARLLSTPSPSSPGASPQYEHPSTIFNITSPPTPTATALAPDDGQASGGAGLTDTPYFSPPRGFQPLPSQPERSSERSASISFNPPTPSHASRPSTSSGRNRDRASSVTAGGAGEKKDPKEVFQDLAVQSKKGFNAFMQKLGGDKGDKEREEGGFVMVGGGGREEDGLGLQRKSTSRSRGKVQEGGALRAVRAKRELDDADKAYRQGVFHLESLRLRREKVQASALTNLEQFNDDLTTRLQKALATYVDIVHATAATNAQATEVVRQAVDRIDPSRDMSLFRSRLMAFKGTPSTAVPYENFYVGPCRSLIFGVSLTDYDFARGEGGDHGRPPTIVEKCLHALDQKGLDTEGLYRISGRKAGVQKTIQDIELDEEKFEFDEPSDVHSIANVLKQYLRELPEPVFLLPHSERVKITENREQLIHSNFAALRSRLRRLPPIHQTTFQAIIEHLGRVQSRSSVNKMGAKNLAVIFNSVLFGADSGPEAAALTLHHQADTVLEDLITFSDLVSVLATCSNRADNQLFSAEVDAGQYGSSEKQGMLAEHAVDDGPTFGSSRTKVKITGSPVSPNPNAASGIALAVTAAGDSVAKLGQASREVDLASVKSTTFTPDSELELLFDPMLIPALMKESVGPDYHVSPNLFILPSRADVQVRPLSSTDLLRSHFALLSDLTSSPPIAPSAYTSIFKHLRSLTGTYYITVIVDKSDDQLVAAATLVVERKHIHGGGSAGHIEEVVVSAKTQGKGLGLKLVRGLKDMAEALGCYKTILDCGEGKVGFYEKCGFKKRGVQMAYYTTTTDASPMFAPTIPLPPVSAAVSRHGSSLALPDLRPPPLPPRPADLDPSTTTYHTPASPERDGTMSDMSSSSPTSRVTYTYPTAAEAEPDTEAYPVWATSGLGSAPLTPRLGNSPERESMSSTPLPPGAAPADLSAEPERVGRVGH